jgi:hypothetical protein
LISYAETSLANIRLGIKGFAMTNTLAYFSGESVTIKTRFETLIPNAQTLLTKI